MGMFCGRTATKGNKGNGRTGRRGEVLDLWGQGDAIKIEEGEEEWRPKKMWAAGG